nr:unnamed protein product [Digitaria exilis]
MASVALELLYVLGGLAALWLVWRALEWGWLRPRRLGRALRAQGLRGTAFRFPSGDLAEETRLLAEQRAKPLPLSSAHDIAARVEPLLHKAINEHGKISMIWEGPTPSVILSDPKLVREVLANKSDYGKHELPSNFVKLIGKGLLTHEGEKWAVHRKIINPAFHLEKLKKMVPAFTNCTIELMGKWEDMIGSDGSAREIDIWPELQDLTGDAISRAAFGSNLSEGRRIFRIQSEQIQLATTMTNLFIPGYSYLPTKLNRRVKRNAREVEALLKAIITKKEVALRNGHADDTDMLGLLMLSNMKESQESGSSEPMMTIDDIVGELKIFYFAGMDTTSVTLTWTMIMLSMHPEWQERARDEVLQVTMVLYEVLRLYPPFTFLARQPHKEVELGGVKYPPGVQLFLPILTIHHDPDVWGKDVNEFKPARFAEGISKASKDGAGFFPFGWGPRRCIGQNFALLEAKVALSMILQRFSFELSPSYTHSPFRVASLQPDHGAQIMLKKI